MKMGFASNTALFLSFVSRKSSLASNPYDFRTSHYRHDDYGARQQADKEYNVCVCVLMCI